ncbi:MAG: site-2 protease family protein, partial [Chloroflexota bacterium]
MESSFTLGKIRGIEIGVHFTWLIVFALVTVSLALGYFPQNFPELSSTTDWLLGAAAALLLFASVLVHELSHSFVAQSKGIAVRGITLFIFGGVSNIQGEPHEARDELLIAAAGPVSSLVLGLVFAGLMSVTQGASQTLTALLSYLAVINISLAIFNLIPGFPLDGGRVFRSIVWLVTGSFEGATRIATAVGQVIAYLFIFGGLLIAFSGSFLSGIWLAFIGWFLSNA